MATFIESELASLRIFVSLGC